MKNVLLWISTMRLRTLPLSISGIILASCIAKYDGHFDWKVFVLAILTTLSLQILSNLANDYGDGVNKTDNDDRIGPERAIQSGKISPEEMFNAIRINILISIVLAFFLVFSAFGVRHFYLTALFFVLGIVSIIAAIKYTMGNNPYGYRALGDVFVFIFFGLLSVMGCYVLYAKEINHVVFLPAISIGLLSTGVLNLNNMRDMKSDEKVRKVTLAVKLGFRKVKIYHGFLIISAIILSALFGLLYYISPLSLVFMMAYIPLTIHLIKVFRIKELKDLDPELKKLALTTFFMSVLMGVGYLV
ncbi:1,4-dihydroxy-2-naphthoate octaprenyltransferase [Hyunsoonleella aestuarii]|uniref:1,4-dihydroxy-2-naphthoate octaprenyltransferase n=1 Tax=Hyunsoonleella aestuarii TaxID=912802 RepID=A0ABP8EE36_9FLAO|nr:1,4-dihydroxy-2-naphthoate octaprenyltransferase [Hyunsoonleella aestuarii]